MDESGINLDFDLAKYIDGEIDYEQFLEDSEALLFPQAADHAYYEIKSKSVDSSSPPTFKTATPTTRTHNKQLLMKEKTLEDTRREQLAKEILDQQRRDQQRRETEIKIQEEQTRPYLKVPQNVGIHVDVPPQVLQVKTALENPTQYHVHQKRRMQLHQYLVEMTQQQRLSQNSLPTSQTTSLPPSQNTNVLPSQNSSLPPSQNRNVLPSQNSSVPPSHLVSHMLTNSTQNLTNTSNTSVVPSHSPDIAMSPGMSSVATSNSEVS